MLINYFSIGIFLLLYLYILKKHPSLLVIFFYFIYGYLSMVVSVFYLDLGGKYAFEVNRESYRSYSMSVLTIFYISSFLIFIAIFKKELNRRRVAIHLERNLLKSKYWVRPIHIKLYLLFMLLYIAVIYVHLFYSGVPIFLGYGKGQFWLYAQIPFFQSLHNQTSTLLFMAGIFYSYAFQYRKLDCSFYPLKKWFRLVLYFYLIYIVLMGYKFGGPLLYLFSFFVSSLIIRSVTYGFSIKVILKYVLVFSAFVVPIIMYIYNVVMKLGDRASELLFDRVFTLQGQVWHFIFNLVQDGNIRPNVEQLFQELKHVVGGVDSTDAGMNYLMQFILPTARLESYLEGGVRLSGGYPANLIITFDNYFVIAITHIVMTIIIGLFHLGLLKAILRFQPIRALLWFKLAFLSEGYLFMGDLNTVFSSKTAVYLVALFFIYAVKSRSRIHG